MSLVIAWKERGFIALACDGLALEKARRGKKFIRASESVNKLWTLSHNAVLGSVGMHWMGEAIAANFTKRFTRDECPTDEPDQDLFNKCETEIPLMARTLLAAHPPKSVEEGLTLTIAGWDAKAERMRAISWLSAQGLEPQELVERGRVTGHEQAQEIAKHLLGHVLDANPNPKPEEVCSHLEWVIAQTAIAVPDFCNDHVKTCVIFPDRSRSTAYPRANSINFVGNLVT